MRVDRAIVYPACPDVRLSAASLRPSSNAHETCVIQLHPQSRGYGVTCAITGWVCIYDVSMYCTAVSSPTSTALVPDYALRSMATLMQILIRPGTTRRELSGLNCVA